MADSQDWLVDQGYALVKWFRKPSVHTSVDAGIMFGEQSECGTFIVRVIIRLIFCQELKDIFMSVQGFPEVILRQVACLFSRGLGLV